MRHRFAGQPFADHPNLVDFIDSARESGFDDLKIAVAWAKRSGLGRLWDVLEEFRADGGKVLLILGVSEGGATKEGLDLALKVTDRCYVFHDPRRTFHPKVYFSSSSSGERSLLIGSSNLTAGGLGWNYEASLWVDWDADEGEDVTDKVSRWFDDLIGQSSSCSLLTRDLIKELEQSDDIMIRSETRARRVQKKGSDTPEDNDSQSAATVSGLFKPVLDGLRSLPDLSSNLPPLVEPAASGGSETSLTGGTSMGETSATAKPSTQAWSSSLPTDDVQRRWFKQLDNTAAQQVKSPKSNPTGNLRLSQESAAIDHKVYFREDFFGGLPWAPTEGKESEQEVVVGFRICIDGEYLGVKELRVSHNPARISDQANVPTVLHWGELGPVLRETSYIGQYISLERTTEGEYNLIISKSPRGDYSI